MKCPLPLMNVIGSFKSHGTDGSVSIPRSPVNPSICADLQQQLSILDEDIHICFASYVNFIRTSLRAQGVDAEDLSTALLYLPAFDVSKIRAKRSAHFCAMCEKNWRMQRQSMAYLRFSDQNSLPRISITRCLSS